MSAARRPRRPSASSLILAFAFAAILVACASALYAVASANTSTAESRLAAVADETAVLLGRFETSVATAPIAVSGLVTTVGADQITKERFNAFSAPLLDEDVVVATRWVPFVPAEQRSAFEERVRFSGGLLEFAIKERDAWGADIPAGVRDGYYPVLFAEPFVDDSESIGFDMGSEPARLRAIRDARDTGVFVSTTPVTLSIGGRGALLMVPAYRGGSVPPTVDDRRAGFQGVAIAVYRPQELLDRATAAHRGEDISFFVYDLGPKDEPAVSDADAILVASRASATAGLPELPTLASVKSAGGKLVGGVDFGQRRQLLAMLPGPGFLAQGQTQPWPIALSAFGSLLAIALYASQRRRFELAMASAAARLRSVLSASPDAFVGLDDGGRVVDWSEQATRLFGIGRDAAIGRPVSSLLVVENPIEIEGVPERPVDEAISSLGPGGDMAAMELTAVRDDGTRVPVDVTMAVSPSDTRWSVAVFVRDASERYRARDELLRARATEAIGELTGRLAHDFNNLLGIIVGTLDLARDDVEDRPATQRMLDMAIAAGSRGADVTKALLAVARRSALAPADIDLNGTVHEMLPLLRQAVGPDIRVDTILAEGPLMTHVDEGGLTNAILNLTINASHAMAEGGVLTVTTRRLENAVSISVADTGTGIPPDVLAHVFEPFYTTKKGGTGLGLAIVHGFATQSKGTAAIQSVVGVGTTVSITLPPAAGETTSLPAAAPCDVTGTERVLVVDDEAGLREITSRWLRDAGYEVHQAGTGPSAYALLDTVRPHLLISDVVMPGEFGGLELARRARLRLPDLRIVLASGYAGVDLEGVIESGLPLLEKPYRRQTLLTAARQVLDASVPVGLGSN